MKHTTIILLFTLLLSACVEKINEPEELIFNFSVSNPISTKVYDGKTVWEDGDVIFVVFADLTEDGKHLKMTYDGTEWQYTTCNGLSISDIEESGSLSAVYLPGVDDIRYLNGDRMWEWDYGGNVPLIDEQRSYSRSGSVVTASLTLNVPDNMVQFVIPEDSSEIQDMSVTCSNLASFSYAGFYADGSWGPTERADPSYVTIDDDSSYFYALYEESNQYNFFFIASYVDAEDHHHIRTFYKRCLDDITNKTVLLPSLEDWCEIGFDQYVTIGGYSWHTVNSVPYDISDVLEDEFETTSLIEQLISIGGMVPDFLFKSDMLEGLDSYIDSGSEELPSIEAYQDLHNNCNVVFIELYDSAGLLYVDSEDPTKHVYFPGGYYNEDESETVWGASANSIGYQLLTYDPVPSIWYWTSYFDLGEGESFYFQELRNSSYVGNGFYPAGVMYYLPVRTVLST